ncbi:hypothetical protein C0Q64_29320 [Streptomyces albidoflavus]|nr:hypothetical protein C0Q64_29320 [Streptomyces albidoflavus]RZD93668.1 hypothetical protein C0Q65_29475 [Streptomyces albidoflavus]
MSVRLPIRSRYRALRCAGVSTAASAVCHCASRSLSFWTQSPNSFRSMRRRLALSGALPPGLSSLCPPILFARPLMAGGTPYRWLCGSTQFWRVAPISPFATKAPLVVPWFSSMAMWWVPNARRYTVFSGVDRGSRGLRFSLVTRSHCDSS